MDPPRSSSRSRRSFPNLHHLSLAPLSSKYHIDDSTPASPSEDPARAPRTSYIQGKSTPSTPGILNLSPSRSKGFAYEGYVPSTDTPERDIRAIPKAKSSSALLPVPRIQPHGPHHKRKGVASVPLHLPPSRHHTTEPSDEWLHRAGLAIADEMRESKGQSWLVRRASSTSLVHQSDGFEEHPSHREGHLTLLSGEHFADDECSPVTPRLLSRFGSRAGSGVASARNSRRGSRVGSRIELIAPSGLQLGDDQYLGEEMVEPDFVEPDDESVGDEEEVARLARERGFGLGGWVDRLIGWTLFKVEEDGEETDDDDDDDDDEGDTERDESLTNEQIRLRKEVEARRKKLEREAIVAASAASPSEKREPSERKETAETQPLPGDEEGGWQDAAWLLSVASKVLL
ncbi:hypothetical protein K432DRAFT_377714 [Lepidopterella palustris CBS 459.81]|uniref:Uncharacterized protein n=1 Tax=Lepidopterella palustris CBS 459.81 TaxID=1314670 RepID=A0A8E2EJW9_9PEZI|nr:hypothetical protein K432DRAFT_377714 [Lepidopterella palustris CBS 459.81]